MKTNVYLKTIDISVFLDTKYIKFIMEVNFMLIYGYARISTPKQSLDHQIRNIKAQYPEATIVKEVYTGTKTEGRNEWNKLYKLILREAKKGEEITLVFDSVSRMSRNADEGIELYMELYDLGVNLVFLKEPTINTETYKSALNKNIHLTGTNVDILLNAINEYLVTLAKDQIRIAFEQAEKEVADLQKRTKDGLQTAKLNGKQLGRKKDQIVVTNKEREMTQYIRMKSKDFNGTLSDVEIIKLTGISKNTYYKYKRKLKNQNK